MASKAFSVYTSFKAKDGVSGIFQNMKNKASDFGGQLNKLKAQSQAVGGGIKKSFDITKGAITGVVTAVAAGTVVNTLNSWVDKASDLQETLGKTNETFKADSNAVVEWSKTSIKSMGLAQQTALDTAALYGDMGAGMGMTTKRAAEMAMSLTQLSADMSSFKNVSQDITSNALKSIYTGETETLKNLGVVMTQDNLEEYAAKAGFGKKFKDMTQTEKIELRYQYVMNATRNSQGDFERTGGNFANQSRMFQEQRKQLETNLGNILLPKYNAIMKSLNSIITKNAPAIEKGFAALFKNFEEGLKICSPLFEKFQELFKNFTTVIMPIFQASMPVIKTLLENLVVPALVAVIDTVNNLFKGIKLAYDIVKGFYDFVKNNWVALLFTLPLMIMGVVGACKLVQTAIDIWRLKMALLKMEGGLLSVVMNTKLVQSITAFTSAVWKSVTALAAQAAAFFASPVGLITLAIMALVGVVILLWKNWDKVTQKVKEWAEWMTGSTFGKVLSCIFPVLGAVALLIKHWDTLKAAVINWWNNTKPLLMEFWQNCQETFLFVAEFFQGQWNKITTSVVNWWNSVKFYLSVFWTVCKEVFAKVGGFIKENFISILLAALGPVGFIISSLMNLPSIIKQIRSGGGIKITGAGGENVKDLPKFKENKNGKIEVVTTIDNKTGYEAKTNTRLQSPSNLNLKPA